MDIRTLLVDSNYLLKKSHNGVKDTYTNSFGFIGGLYGFMTILRKLIKENKINKVVLVWDGENGGVYRHKIDAAYKANRKNKSWYDKIELTDKEIKLEKEKQESILKQRKRIQTYCEELFLRQIEVDDIEADDIIASYCQTYYKKEDILLYTNDRDFLQLLDYNISILFGNKDEIVNKFNFLKHFQYHYSNSLAIKILCGDTADNIAGIKGIQEKTLLNHFPELLYKKVSVNDIRKKSKIINEDRIKEKKKPLKALENIVDNRERLLINYKLTNLNEPILNTQAIEDIEQLDMPLSPDGRSSKNLYKMMNEDEFFTIYKGTFVNYIEPFYSVIMTEKEIFNKYKKMLYNI